jgi:hypothetical protein
VAGPRCRSEQAAANASGLSPSFVVARGCFGAVIARGRGFAGRAGPTARSGHLGFATVLTLIVVPLLYAVFFSVRNPAR